MVPYAYSEEDQRWHPAYGQDGPCQEDDPGEEWWAEFARENAPHRKQVTLGDGREVELWCASEDETFGFVDEPGHEDLAGGA